MGQINRSLVPQFYACNNEEIAVEEHKKAVSRRGEEAEFVDLSLL